MFLSMIASNDAGPGLGEKILHSKIVDYPILRIPKLAIVVLGVHYVMEK